MGVLAGPHGDVYAVEELDVGNENMSEVYRLAPGRNALAKATEPRPPLVHIPHEKTLLLVAATSATGLGTTSSYWFRPDGSRISHPAQRIADLCASTGGRAIAFTSDATVPREPFVYVAPAKSRSPRKVGEQAGTPVCPFDGRHLVLSTEVRVGYGPVWSLDAYDVRSRHLAHVVNGTPQFAVSPDGRHLAYVGRSSRGDSVVVLDLGTGRTRTIAGPIDRGVVSPHLLWYYKASDDLEWSPDGRRVAFVTGRTLVGRELGTLDFGDSRLPPRSYAVSIADVDGHPLRRVATIMGGPPTVSWSQDGTKLLVCAAARPPAHGCQGDVNLGTSSALHLVNAIGPVRDVVVASGEIDFAGWNPAGDGYAWAEPGVLHLASGRTLPLPYLAQRGGWVGWSPGGRYITTGRDDGYTVIDLVTGKQRALLSAARAENADVRWWR